KAWRRWAAMSSDSTGVLAGQAPARGSRRWHWIVGFGAVIVALGCVGFAVYWWTRPAPPPPTPPISKPDPKKFGTEEGAKEFADQCAYNKEKEASPFTGHRRGGGFMEKELRDALHFSVEQANFDPVTGYWTVTGILAFDGPVTAITLPDGR